MPDKPSPRQLAAENQDLRARLEKAEETLSEILSGDADALYVAGTGGAQLFTLKGADKAYRTLFNNMSEGALTLTPEGLILYANRRFAEMLGAPLEKVIGSGIHAWFAPESRQVLQTLLRKDTLDNHREELTLAAADGTQVPVYLSVSRLLVDDLPDSFCMIATDLTEQKRNEAILADAKLVRAILEQAVDAIVICDVNGRIIRASKQAQALYGTSPLGQQFERAFPLRLQDGTAFSTVSIIGANRRISAEARLEHDGQGFDLLASVGHLKDEQNKLLGSVITLTDITERKIAEEEIKFKNTILQTQQETSPDAILMVDEYGQIISYNQQFIELWRLSSQVVSALDDVSVLQSVLEQVENSEAFSARVQYLYEHHQEKSHEEISFKDGRTIDRHTSPVTGANGKYYGRVWYFRDITERKQAAQKLSESERRYSDLLGNVALVAMMLDREARITYCNEYLLHLTGWRYEEVIGKNWVELFLPPEIAQQKKQFFAELLLNRTEATHHENEILTRTGERRLIRWSNSVLRSGAGDVTGTASIGEDITERKTAEARIKYLNRVHTVLSGINTLIVRVHDRDVLFNEACRIAVDKGGFRMALIGIVDNSVMRIVPVASAGKDEELVIAIKSILSSGELASTTMVARAIREKQAIVSNDSQSDPQVLFGQKYADSGIRSMVILPLIVSDQAIGAIALYAGEIDFFHEEEMQLLTELAGDIAFAIDHIGKQERINYLAYYDELTGLANRSLFLERLAPYIRSAVSGAHQLAIGMIDLDRFKNINDSLGRVAGDALLKQVAEWLTYKTGDANLLARIEADHFAFVVPEVKSVGNLAKLVENLMAAFLEHSFRLNDAVFRINIKVGIALFPDDGEDADTLFRNAEAALKKAKASGERFLFYTQKMTQDVAGKLTLENQLRQAIENEEFVLHYQPKVNFVSGKVTSAEALIRWNDPRTGLVPPGMFIPILEETGMIYEVGRWALRKAAEDHLRWREAGLSAVRIAVNVSPLQLRNLNFIDEIKQVIALDAHAATGLELEITESVIMNDIKHNIATLQAIRALGITIAIDDFGTGFSSLSYLAKLPVDTLKIDRSFVIDMTAGPEGLALVSTIISLAHSLNLKVVAEGVETEEQSHLLRLLKCDEMQGYLFSKPVPAEIFETRFLAPPPVE